MLSDNAQYVNYVARPPMPGGKTSVIFQRSAESRQTSALPALLGRAGWVYVAVV